MTKMGRLRWLTGVIVLLGGACGAAEDPAATTDAAGTEGSGNAAGADTTTLGPSQGGDSTTGAAPDDSTEATAQGDTTGANPASEPTGEILTFVYHRAANTDPIATSLDVFPMTQADNPVLVFFHGGNLRREMNDPNIDAKVGIRDSNTLEMFQRLGYVVVSTNYRELGEVETVDQPGDSSVADGARALAWVEENIATYGGDPDTIVLYGYSAGAYLAGMLAVDPAYLEAQAVAPASVRAAILGDTVMYDVPRAVATAAEFGFPASATRLPQIFTTDTDRQREASVITHIGATTPPPFFIMYAHVKDGIQHTLTEDQSVVLAEALQEAGGQASLHWAAGYNHGSLSSTLGLADQPATLALTEFLEGL